MQKWVSNFFSEFHKGNLKPLGFKKVRHTFSRDMGEYWERINFQGSAWNFANEPWMFYINAGIEFKDLPEGSAVLSSHTHWKRRIEEIVKKADSTYSVTPDKNDDELAALITVHIQEASRVMASDIKQIRRSYIAKGHDR